MKNIISPQKMFVLHAFGAKKMTSIVVSESLCHTLDIDINQISAKGMNRFYVLISRLKNDGFIETVDKTAPSRTRGGKSKEKYRCTKKGIEARNAACDFAQMIIDSNLKKREVTLNYHAQVYDDKICDFDGTDACDKCSVRPCKNDQSYD